MKKFALPLLFSIFYAGVTHAQGTRGEFFVGVGAASERDFETAGIWKKSLTGSGSTTTRSSGVYHLGYLFFKRERMSIGILATAESLKVVTTGAPMPENFGKSKESRDLHFALLLDCRYEWGRRPASRWYSGVAPGIAWTNRKQMHNDFSSVSDEFSKARAALQVTAVGLEFGKRVGGYIELGYGAKGLLAAGVSWRP